MLRYMGQFSRQRVRPSPLARSTAVPKKSSTGPRLFMGSQPPPSGMERERLMPVEQMIFLTPNPAAKSIRRHSSSWWERAVSRSSSVKFRQ